MSKTLKSKNPCYPCSQKPRVLIFTLASFELFGVLPCSSSPDNGVSLGSISVFLHTSDVIFAVWSFKLLRRMVIKSPFLQLILYWISNLLPQVQDVDRLLIFQPYQSLIESHNSCLDNSKSNLVIGTTVNQFETPVGVDMSTRHFSLSFIFVVNLSMTFLQFSSFDFFYLSFESLSIIFDYVVL